MAAIKWTADPAHSEVQFKVRHLMISTVTGVLKKIGAQAQTSGNDFTNATIIFTADADSIDTNNEQRDQHLKTADFFDSAKYPKIIFESTQMEKTGAENYKLSGNLTIKGITKPIVLDVEFGGMVEKDRFGHTRVGFTLSGKIKRHDFGVGPVNPGLGDEIKLYSNLQLVKQMQN